MSAASDELLAVGPPFLSRVSTAPGSSAERSRAVTAVEIGRAAFLCFVCSLLDDDHVGPLWRGLGF